MPGYAEGMKSEDRATDPVGERLRELFPSCETDCTDGCKYGCLGWLHRFTPPEPTPASDSDPHQAP